MTHEYVGTKIVTAWPAAGPKKVRVCGVDCKTGDEHCNGYCKGDSDAPPAVEPQAGYAVKYEDGYTSWSPKEVFEKAYISIGHVSNLPPHQQRVIGEKAQLDDNRTKLRAFLDTGLFQSLPEAERSRLANQLVAMGIYSDILGERIAAF